MTEYRKVHKQDYNPHFPNLSSRVHYPNCIQLPGVPLNNNQPQSNKILFQERGVDTEASKTPQRFFKNNDIQRENKENCVCLGNSPRLIKEARCQQNYQSPIRSRATLNHPYHNQYYAPIHYERTPRPVTLLDKSNCSIASNKTIKDNQATPTLPSCDSQPLTTINRFHVEPSYPTPSPNQTRITFATTNSHRRDEHKQGQNVLKNSNICTKSEYTQKFMDTERHSCINCQREAHYKAATTCKYYCTECAIAVMVKGVQLIQKSRTRKSIEKNREANKKNEKYHQTTTKQQKQSKIDKRGQLLQIETIESRTNEIDSKEPYQRLMSQPRQFQLKEFLQLITKQQSLVQADLASLQQQEQRADSNIEQIKKDIHSHYQKIQQALKASQMLDLDYLERLHLTIKKEATQTRQKGECQLTKLNGIRKDIEPNIQKIVEKVQQSKYREFMHKYRNQIQKIVLQRKLLDLNYNTQNQLNSKIQNELNYKSLKWLGETETVFDPALYEPLLFRVYGGESSVRGKKCEGELQSTIMAQNSDVFFSFDKKHRELQL